MKQVESVRYESNQIMINSDTNPGPYGRNLSPAVISCPKQFFWLNGLFLYILFRKLWGTPAPTPFTPILGGLYDVIIAKNLFFRNRPKTQPKYSKTEVK